MGSLTSINDNKRMEINHNMAFWHSMEGVLILFPPKKEFTQVSIVEDISMAVLFNRLWHGIVLNTGDSNG